MFERFTREARFAVSAAETEARELGSPTIEAEHLLLALASLDRATTVGGVLAEVGLGRDDVIAALDAERERSLAAVGISIGDFDVPPPRPTTKPRMRGASRWFGRTSASSPVTSSSPSSGQKPARSRARYGKPAWTGRSSTTGRPRPSTRVGRASPRRRRPRSPRASAGRGTPTRR